MVLPVTLRVAADSPSRDAVPSASDDDDDEDAAADDAVAAAAVTSVAAAIAAAADRMRPTALPSVAVAAVDGGWHGARCSTWAPARYRWAYGRAPPIASAR